MRNVTKRVGKNGVSYRIKISNGYDINGKQIVRSMTYNPDSGMTNKQIEKEVERQAILFEDKVRRGFAIDENMRFAEYAERFMAIKEIAPKTRERYKELLIRINQAIGHIRLGKIQPMHLQAFYADLKNIISKKTKQPLADRTINHYHRLISAILSHACRAQVISRNVARREYMEAPKFQEEEPNYLDDVEAKHIAELLLDEPDIRKKTAIILLIYTGYRRGELCGLEWSDVDFKNHIIHTRRNSQYIRKVGIITKAPKNKSSIRPMKLPPVVFTLLEEYRQWQRIERVKNGDRWNPEIDIIMPDGKGFKTVRVKNDRLFTTAVGKPLFPDTINFWIEKFREKNQLTEFTPHTLRHTNVTLQIAAGVSVRTIAARAGHSKTSTTTNIYSHAIKSADEAASQAIDSILTSAPSEEKNG